MITCEEIQKAIAQILKSKTGFKVYENDVIEGFTAPCFFVEVKIVELEAAGISTFKVTAECKVAFFSKIDASHRIRNEPLIEGIMSKISTWFFPYIRVGDRALTITFSGTELLGENSDILVCSFSTSYFDSLEEAENEKEPIITVNITEKIGNKINLQGAELKNGNADD